MSTILPGNQESAALALDGGVYGLLARRHVMQLKEALVINATDNPKIMAALYAKGLAPNPEGMTAKQCASAISYQVPSNDFFERFDMSGECFDAFKYFINCKVMRVGMFNGSNLAGITLPPNLITIGSQALAGFKGTTITIPASVRSIVGLAFQAAWWLGKVICDGSTPFKIVSNSFASSTTTFYVPDDAVEAYKSAWSGIGTYSDRVKPISDL